MQTDFVSMESRAGAGRMRRAVSYRSLSPFARRAIAVCTNALIRPPEADRILVIRLGAVGDVVRTLPAVARLRAAYPGAHLTWLVESSAASVVQGQPAVDEVIVFPREELVAALLRGRVRESAAGFADLLRRLRSRRFDLAVDFHSLLRSSVLARLSGARRRIGYASPVGRELSYVLATDRAELVPGRLSRFDRNVGLVEYLGIDAPPPAKPLIVSAIDRARMEAQLAPDVPVALHPGSSDATLYKRWAPEAFASLARTLFEENGVPSLVTVGPGREDLDLARAVVEASAGAAKLAPATPTLRELAALLSATRLCVAGDTGPLHVASLVGTPVVQLQGPTDPVENAPYPGTPWRTVRVGIACSPCRRGCAAATCMRLIEPDAVVRVVRELLLQTGGTDAGADRLGAIG